MKLEPNFSLDILQREAELPATAGLACRPTQRLARCGMPRNSSRTVSFGQQEILIYSADEPVVSSKVTVLALPVAAPGKQLSISPPPVESPFEFLGANLVSEQGGDEVETRHNGSEDADGTANGHVQQGTDERSSSDAASSEQRVFLLSHRPQSIVPRSARLHVDGEDHHVWKAAVREKLSQLWHCDAGFDSNRFNWYSVRPQPEQSEPNEDEHVVVLASHGDYPEGGVPLFAVVLCEYYGCDSAHEPRYVAALIVPRHCERHCFLQIATREHAIRHEGAPAPVSISHGHVAWIASERLLDDGDRLQVRALRVGTFQESRGAFGLRDPAGAANVGGGGLPSRVGQPAQGEFCLPAHTGTPNVGGGGVPSRVGHPGSLSVPRPPLRLDLQKLVAPPPQRPPNVGFAGPVSVFPKVAVEEANRDLRELQRYEQLHENTVAALQLCRDFAWLEATRIHFYTDGARVLDQGEPFASWGIVVIGESARGQFKFGGYFAGSVQGDEFSGFAWNAKTSYAAEVLAIAYALSAVFHVPNVPCIIHSDCLSAGLVTAGAVGRTRSQVRDINLAVRALCLAVAAQRDTDVEIRHIRGHSGQPWNELADAAAKRVVSGVIGHQHVPWNRAPGEASFVQSTVQHAWLFRVTGDGEFPEVDNDVFVRGDFVPAQHVPRFWQHESPRHEWRQLQCEATFGTYNVLTLKQPGKVQLLEELFDAAGLCVVGLQEARADDKKLQVANCAGAYIRVSSGADNAIGGCEIWLSTRHSPFHKQGQPLCWDARSVVEVYASSRLLAITAVAGGVQFALISGHCPSVSDHPEDSAQWWALLDEVFGKLPQGSLPILLLDANARFSAQVARVDTATALPANANGFALQEFAGRHRLAISDFCDADGAELVTWHGKRQATSCLDFLLIPWYLARSALATCTLPEIADHFPFKDHVPVAWTIKGTVRRPVVRLPSHSCRFDVRKLYTLEGQQALEQIWQHIPPVAWEVNATEHEDSISECLQLQLSKVFPVPAKRIRRPYYQEGTWEILCTMRACKRTLRSARNYVAHGTCSIVFGAWKSIVTGAQDHPLPGCSLDEWKRAQNVFDAQCSRTLKHAAKQFKCSASKDKAAFCHKQLAASWSSKGSAGLYQQLRPLIGTSKKCVQRTALPSATRTQNADISCVETRLVLQEHFADAEHGQQKSPFEHFQHAQLGEQRCFADRSAFAVRVSDVPALSEVEEVIRQLPRFKAAGLSGVPADAYIAAAPAAARAIYPLLLKAFVRGDEPLAWKGGLVAAFAKPGKNPAILKNWRAILLEEAGGKILHKLIRRVLEPYLMRVVGPVQCGGVPGRALALPRHQVLAHARWARKQKLSSCILFIDGRDAFYRLIRQVVCGPGSPSEHEATRRFIDKLHPSEAVCDTIADVVFQGHVLAQAEVPELLQHWLNTTFRGTWFTTIPGAGQIVATATGSKPGDPLADQVFQFAVAAVTDSICQDLQRAGISECVQLDAQQLQLLRSIDAASPGVVRMPIVSWADDLALAFSAPSPEKLCHDLQVATRIVLERMRDIGIPLNFAPDKTAAVVSLRGPGSQEAKRKVLIQGECLLPVPLADGTCVQLPVVRRYKHLGVSVEHSHSLPAVLHERVAASEPTFRGLHKHLLRNPFVPGHEKLQVFKTLVLTRLACGSELWQIAGENDQKAVDSVFLRFYRRLLRRVTGHCDKEFDDTQVCNLLGLMHPSGYVTLARLRHFASVCATGPVELWAYLIAEGGWLDTIAVDLRWLLEWKPLPGRFLTDDGGGGDCVDFARLIASTRAGQFSFKCFLKSASRAIDRYLHRASETTRWRVDFDRLCCEVGCHVLPVRPLRLQASAAEWDCPQCGCAFASKAALNTHRYRSHGRRSAVLSLCRGTVCLACQKEYHDVYRLRKHLEYSDRCATKLIESDICFDELPLDKVDFKVRAFKPVVQLAGPKPFWAWLSPEKNEVGADFAVEQFQCDEGEFECALLDAWTRACKAGSSLGLRVGALRRVVQRFAASFADIAATFSQITAGLAEELASEPADGFVFALHVLPWTLREHWPDHVTVHNQHAHFFIDQLVEGERLVVDYCGFQHAVNSSGLAYGSLIINLFAGHRQDGDVQCWVERFASAAEVALTVVSLDVAIHEEFGNINRSEIARLLQHLIVTQQLLAWLARPPRETWSIEREGAVAGRRAPRILRDAGDLWGRPCISAAEHKQVLLGNQLLQQSLLLFPLSVRYRVGGLLEHPSFPSWSDNAANAASIWRLAEVRRLTRIPGICAIDVQQHPTTLLHTGLPWLPKLLSSWKMPISQRATLCKSHSFCDGAWASSHPERLCCVFAASLVLRCVTKAQVGQQVVLSPEALQLVEALQQCWDPYGGFGAGPRRDCAG